MQPMPTESNESLKKDKPFKEGNDLESVNDIIRNSIIAFQRPADQDHN